MIITGTDLVNFRRKTLKINLEFVEERPGKPGSRGHLVFGWLRTLVVLVICHIDSKPIDCHNAIDQAQLVALFCIRRYVSYDVRCSIC